MAPADRLVDSAPQGAEPTVGSAPDADRGSAGAPAVIATILGIGAVVEVILWAVLSASAGRSVRRLVVEQEVNAAIVAVSFGVVATVVLRRRPRHALGWLFAAIAQLEGLSSLGVAYGHRAPALPAAGLAAWLGATLWWPGAVAGAALLTPLFPDGRPASRRWWPLVWAGGVCVVVATVSIVLTDALVPGNPLAVAQRWREPLLTLTMSASLGALLCGATGAVLLAVRMWRTTGAERRRIAWFFAAFTVVVLATALPVGALPELVATAFLPVAMGVAMLRYGLFDADRLLSRTLVYTVLSLLVAGVFGLSIGLASSVLGGTAASAVIAAVVVALGLSPARDLVQRSVDRLLYGQRRDPYAALTDLGRRLSAAVGAEETLPIVVQTVSTALRLPYAAVMLGDDPVPAAYHGNPTEVTVELPLRHASEPVGLLTVGLPDGHRYLDPADERLLLSFARQAGTAVHAVRLARDLRLSHDRLAAARDEERHRIRRDLHDQLGPTLAGVALGLGAAKRAVAGNTPDAVALLEHLQLEVRGGLNDVKRLIADLRPTELEQHGLLAALRQHAAAVSTRSGDALAVAVDVAGPIPPLPSRAEVAAYRIALEAVTNAARHSNATDCRIHLNVHDSVLELSVRDNGVGLPSQPHHLGLGLRSMAERAAELGGRCTIGPNHPRGAIVEATLPLGSSR